MAAWRTKGVLDHPSPQMANPPDIYSNWQNCTCGETNLAKTNTVTIGDTNYSWGTNFYITSMTNGMTYFIAPNFPPVTNRFERDVYGIKVSGYEIQSWDFYQDVATQIDFTSFPGTIVMRTNRIIFK